MRVSSSIPSTHTLRPLSKIMNMNIYMVIFRLRPDDSFFIASGLKGLCGSIAVYLGRHGARNWLLSVAVCTKMRDRRRSSTAANVSGAMSIR